ncbi:MAG TPA: hypothetical protein VIM71_13485, partial [Lacunisphaera sp.]
MNGIGRRGAADRAGLGYRCEILPKAQVFVAISSANLEPSLMNRFFGLLFTVTFASVSFAAMAEPNPLVLPLWAGTPPNSQPAGQPEKRAQEGSIVWVWHVSNPAVEVRLPARGNATGQAVVVCPGGGYGGLAYDWEGTDFAGWLN